MDVGSPFPANPQASEAVQPREGPLHDPAIGAQSRAMPGSAAGDRRHDAASADLVTVNVVIVTPVGEQVVGLAAGAADPAADRWDRVEQRQQLSDIVAVAASQQERERSALPVSDQMMSRAGPSPVDRRGTRVDPPFRALTWEEPTIHRDQSNRRAAFSSASRTSCSLCHTPASFQSLSRRQHVMPEPKPRSCGRSSHWIPVCSTYKIPHSTSRSGSGLRPGYRNLRSRCDSNGFRRSHSSSDTIHGDVPTSD